MGGVQKAFNTVCHALFSPGVHLAGWLGVDTLVPADVSKCESVALKFCLLCLLSNKPLHFWVVLHSSMYLKSARNFKNQFLLGIMRQQPFTSKYSNVIPMEVIDS